nr:redox-regulated ATPase YchF [Bacillota bacterium]
MLSCPRAAGAGPFPPALARPAPARYDAGPGAPAPPTVPGAPGEVPPTRAGTTPGKGLPGRDRRAVALSVGIVGLPNVGKSTLFNALTRAGAEAANYPFCTIEPNVGVVPVPDPRLDALAALYRPRSLVPATVTFVDIAGLVRGASKGEGLGNQFLHHIREVDAVAHVVRCFDDPDVSHVEGSIDPLRDVEIIETELILADLETVQRQHERYQKVARSKDRDAELRARTAGKLLEALSAGRPARSVALDDEEQAAARTWHLLTMKPLMYVANVSEADLADPMAVPGVQALVEHARQVSGAGGEVPVVAVSAAIEAELAELDEEDRRAMLAELGVEEPGLHRVIRTAYRLLGLITFFTAGENEVRAWTIRQGTRAAEAAGEIHSDMERGFIRAEVVPVEDLLRAGSWAAAREQGLLRLEGRDYVVRDGDVIYVRFNV